MEIFNSPISTFSSPVRGGFGPSLDPRTVAQILPRLELRLAASDSAAPTGAPNPQPPHYASPSADMQCDISAGDGGAQQAIETLFQALSAYSAYRGNQPPAAYLPTAYSGRLGYGSPASASWAHASYLVGNAYQLAG